MTSTAARLPSQRRGGVVPPSQKLALIEVKDYLEATIEASKRTRSVLISMTVASALIFGALINSFKHQWMLERMQAFSSPHSAYAAGKLGPYPDPADYPPKGNPKNPAMRTFEQATKEYLVAYRSFYAAMARTYVESLSTRVPLFGFSVDANDLGMLGGLALIVLVTITGSLSVGSLTI